MRRYCEANAILCYSCFYAMSHLFLVMSCFMLSSLVIMVFFHLQIFSRVGKVMKIVTFTKNNSFQALIQYPDVVTAQAAKLVSPQSKREISKLLATFPVALETFPTSS